MSEIKAIETRYAGYRFRSRLEARWAVFFNALSIKYEYEKEGFDLGEAGWYLPDFWLPDHQCWIEIKGQAPTLDERNKAAHLCLAANTEVYIFTGDFSEPRFDRDAPAGEDFLGAWAHRYFPPAYREKTAELALGEPDPDWIDYGESFGGTWAACQLCEGAQPYVGLWGSSAWMDHILSHGENAPTKRGGFPDSDPLILAAYATARASRFEFGESGAPQREAL